MINEICVIIGFTIMGLGMVDLISPTMSNAKHSILGRVLALLPIVIGLTFMWIGLTRL